MSGRPYGGVNERPDDGHLPGEQPDDETVTADRDQSPRAAEGPMSEVDQGVPGSGTAPSSAGPPDAGRP